MSDLGLHSLSMSHKKEAKLIWVIYHILNWTDLCLLGNYHAFLSSAFFFQSQFFQKILEWHLSVKQIGPRSGPTVVDLDQARRSGLIWVQSRLSAGNELKWVLLLFLIECKRQETKYTIETCLPHNTRFFVRKNSYHRKILYKSRSVCPSITFLVIVSSPKQLEATTYNFIDA